MKYLHSNDLSNYYKTTYHEQRSNALQCLHCHSLSFQSTSNNREDLWESLDLRNSQCSHRTPCCGWSEYGFWNWSENQTGRRRDYIGIDIGSSTDSGQPKRKWVTKTWKVWKLHYWNLELEFLRLLFHRCSFRSILSK